MSYRVWSRFQAKGNGGSLLKFSIQDLPKSRIYDAAELFMKYFVKEEKLHRAAGIVRNPQAVSQCLAMVSQTMKDPASHYMMCCEDSEDQDNDMDGRMVGVLGMSKVAVGYQPSKDTKTIPTELEKLSKLVKEISLNRIMKDLHVENYYNRGLVVQPEYRQFGIATQFFKARNLASVKYNIPATGALITSVATQKIAEKEGWKNVHNVNLVEIGRKHGVPLDGIAKIMVWKNPQYKQEVC